MCQMRRVPRHTRRRKQIAACAAFGDRLDSGLPNRQTTTPSDAVPHYTGKPNVPGLGYAFLFRNYRASLGKWQTADPMGYPDGWNQLAYCGNGVASAVDLWGANKWDTTDFVSYYYQFWEPRDIDTDMTGYTEDLWDHIYNHIMPLVVSQINVQVRDIIQGAYPDTGHGVSLYQTSNSYSVFVYVHWVFAGGNVGTWSQITYDWWDETTNDGEYRFYSWTSLTNVLYSDSFSDPAAFRESIGTPIEFGFPYFLSHLWEDVYRQGSGMIKKVVE